MTVRRPLRRVGVTVRTTLRRVGTVRTTLRRVGVTVRTASTNINLTAPSFSEFCLSRQLRAQ